MSFRVLDERDIPRLAGVLGVVKEESGSVIHLTDASDFAFKNIIVHGKSTQEGTPTPSAPIDIVSMDNPVVGVYGKNLAHPVGKERTVNGYTITPNADGTITISGSAIAAVDTVLDLALIMTGSTYEVTRLKANVTYSLRCWKDGVLTETPGTKQVLADGTTKWGWTNLETQDRYINKLYRQFVPEVGDTSVCGTYAIQIEVGSNGTDYEPYKEQRLTIPHLMCGIPVSSGGNYTDANGQRWVCDEVDLERGVYIQRVKYQEITDTPKFNETTDQLGRFSWACLPDGGFKTGREVCLSNYGTWRAWGISDGKSVDYCGVSVSQIYYSPATTMTNDEVNALFANMIANGTPPAILAQLETPIEIDLTDEQKEAFASMTSHKGTTNVFTNSIGEITVEYAADLKAYIDNEIAKSVSG